MIQYNVFPEGKRKIVTFSYDDGPANDPRLVELFNKYGFKATFHLNSGKYRNYSLEQQTELRERYKGHEISCHTVSHGWTAEEAPQSLLSEVWEDRKNLERISGYPVVGMSYPYGDFSDESIAIMKTCGIVYSRTVNSVPNFKMPTDFMRWNPSCHHNAAEDTVTRFLSTIDSKDRAHLLYIWGHSFEFTSEELWEKFENSIKRLANDYRIWYATNIDIYNYRQAQRRLVISADESVFYNPSAITVYVEKDKSEMIKIPAGELVKL